MPHTTAPSSPSFLPELPSLATGRYRHYKGQFYDVMGVARHSETLEPLVIYRPQYGERGLWARPAAMFMEQVCIEGQWVPRFAHCPEEHSPE